MGVYGSTINSLTVNPGNVKALMLPSRPGRVSVTVSGFTAPTVAISISETAGDVDIIAALNPQRTEVMQYKEYGILLQLPLFIHSSGAGAFTVSVAEVYYIPGCDP